MCYLWQDNDLQLDSVQERQGVETIWTAFRV